MSDSPANGRSRERLAALAQRVLAGGELNRDEALELFKLNSRADTYELLAWANRIREHFKGNVVRLCSIVNLKAGGCPENCRFCAQSARYETAAPRHGLLSTTEVLAAAEEAARHGATGFGLVAAWRGLEEGPILDGVCDQLQALSRQGRVRPDASLGIIRSPRVAARLKAAGCQCYNHNLETSRRFFPQICDSHSYDERLETLRHLRQAGIRICSGGILGLGETPEDRCDLALALREAGAEIVPINILTPIPGTPLAQRPPVPPLEILHSIACFRFLLPRQEILVAGGRVVNLRDLQSFIFMAGASALMVGNYLTTPNQPVERDLQMLRDLGLRPERDVSGAGGSADSAGTGGLA